MIHNHWGFKVPQPLELPDYPEAILLARNVLTQFFLQYCRNYELAITLARTVTFGECDDRTKEQGVLELQWRSEIAHHLSQNDLCDAFIQRAQTVFDQVQKHITGSRILDLGCGDGQIGVYVSQFKGVSEVCLADVIDYRSNLAKSIGFDLIQDGMDLPYTTNSFDTVLLLTVLHHSNDPTRLFQEATRIARTRIIVIESVFGVESDVKLSTVARWDRVQKYMQASFEFCKMDSINQLAYCAYIDWIYNRVLHSNVNTPFNYNTPQGWNTLASRFGFISLSCEYLGFDQAVVPEFHTLNVFQKM